jgi:hypothetical protein
MYQLYGLPSGISIEGQCFLALDGEKEVQQLCRMAFQCKISQLLIPPVDLLLKLLVRLGKAVGQAVVGGNAERNGYACLLSVYDNGLLLPCETSEEVKLITLSS